MTELEFQAAQVDRARAQALESYAVTLIAETDPALLLMRASVPQDDQTLANSIKTAWLGVVTSSKTAAETEFATDPGTV